MTLPEPPPLPKDLERIARLSDPVYLSKQVSHWKVVAGAALSLVAGGFSGALWLHANFAGKVDVDNQLTEMRRSQAELTKSVNQLTVSMTQTTTLLGGVGRLVDETRQDVRDIKKAETLPAKEKERILRRSRPQPPDFDELLNSVLGPEGSRAE